MEEDIFSVNADLTVLKELEETLKENPDKEWLEYDGRKWIKEDYVIWKSKVKEILSKEKLPLTIVGGRRNAKTLEYGKKLGKIEACLELLGEE